MNNKLNIHKVTFTNFKTFLDETEISFILESKNVDTCNGFLSKASNHTYLSPAITVAGGEQSRVNSIEPLVCVASFIAGKTSVSDRSAINLSTHPASKERHGSIVLDFELNRKMYRYVLDFGSERVVFESLHVKSSKFFSYVFVRDGKTRADAPEIKVAKFGVTEKLLRCASPNVSVIAAAAKSGSLLAQKLVAAFSCLVARNNLVCSQDILPADILAAAQVFAKHDGLRRQMVAFLAAHHADLLDVLLKKHCYSRKDGKKSALYIPYGVRGNCVAAEEQALPLWAESREFLTVFVQLSKLLPVLSRGGVAVVDGLDSGVPAAVLPRFVDLFMRNDTNPHGAQLLFTTNSLDVLKCMQVSQIYLMNSGRCQ